MFVVAKTDGCEVLFRVKVESIGIDGPT